jgi:phospholipid/cholesterol/gamma-HCH transport system substrate-binding protein
MLLRKTIIQLVLFAIISVAGVSYAAWQYAGGDEVIGKRTYPVRVELADGGGIFENGEVTYRGVKVGQIKETRLRQDGVEAEIEIDNSAPKIPADTEAVVADRSAVGEQYIDLRPKTTSGPFLSDVPSSSRVIQQRNTQTPPPVQDLITRVNDLATSVPTGSLRTVVDELNEGLGGSGADLQRLLDATSNFTAAADANFGPTKQLLHSGRTVLDTQLDTAGSLRSFSKDLRGIAATLKGSDSDIRRLITTTPQVARQATAVINENANNVGSLLANLVSTTGLVSSRDPGLRQLLSTAPMIPGAAASVLPGDGSAHIGLALNLFDPPPCVRGYEGTPQRPGQGPGALSDAAANDKAYCAEPRGSPTDVRGSQNAPVSGESLSTPTAPSITENSTQSAGSGGMFGGYDLGPSLGELLGSGG